MIAFKKIKPLFYLVILFLTIFSRAQETRPNILVVLCDDLGYSDVGFSGSKDIITPEIDKLAHDGVIFTSAYVAHPFCGPSRAAFLTGRYPQEIGVPYNLYHNSSQDDKDNMGVPVAETYMARVLQEAGYYTSAIGKWHVGAAPKYHPNKRGFDNFFGFLGGGHEYFPEKYQEAYQQQLKEGNNDIRDYFHPMEHNGKPIHETEYLTDAFSREAVRDIKTASEKKKPFFLYLAYNAPHVPLQAKAEDLQKFLQIEDKDRRTYAAMVYAVDRGVGQIVKALKQTGQFDNTLIVFLSDNGGNTDHGANNYPFKGTKGDTWEGGYRVPMFFHWPQKIIKGKRFDLPVSSLDLYPTFVQLAETHIPKDKKLDGKDIMGDLLSGKDLLKNRMIYALRYREGYNDVGGRQGDWKITRMANEPWGLYNITEDKGEKKDLSGKYPELLEKMASQTEKWTKDFVRPLWFYSLKDQELWNSGSMPRYDETFEIDKLVLPPSKN